MGRCELARGPGDAVGSLLKVKRILVLMGRSADGSERLESGLDIALTYVALDLEVWVLMVDEGVRDAALKDNDSGDWIELLRFYGVERFIAEKESLDERGMTNSSLREGVELINRSSVSNLLQQFELHVSL